MEVPDPWRTGGEPGRPERASGPPTALSRRPAGTRGHERLGRLSAPPDQRRLQAGDDEDLSRPLERHRGRERAGHASPPTLAAVDAAVIDMTAFARFEHHLREFSLKD